MLKKTIAFFLAIIIVFAMPSCVSMDQEPSVTAQESTHGAQTETEKILISELANYRIVYAKGLSKEIFTKIRDLQNLVQEKFGARLRSSDDTRSEQEQEILIGITNRAVAAAVFATAPKADDYAIGITEKKLVVAAHTEEALVSAMDTLLNMLKTVGSDSQFFFDAEMCKTVTGTYGMETILLGEHNIAEYTVVCDGSDEGLVLSNRIQAAIRSKCGYLLPISNTPIDGKMILVGKTSEGTPTGMPHTSRDYYYVGMENANLYLYGEELPTAYRAVEAFCKQISDAEGDVASLKLSERSAVYFQDTIMTAMSFNVRCKPVDEQRMANVVDTVQRYLPDTFGVQEATDAWMTYLNGALNDQYAYVGEEAGGGEYNAVFYRTDQFELIDFGTKWLSDTPDIAGSKIPEAAYPRIFTYAHLKIKSTGEELIHVNTHVDHLGQGEQVRLAQVQVITDFLKSNYPNTPTILTADMNETADKPSVSHLYGFGFENSAELAVVSDSTPSYKDRIIDFLLVSDQDFFVYRYTVDVKQYNGEYASDHRAIVMQYQLLKSSET